MRMNYVIVESTEGNFASYQLGPNILYILLGPSYQEQFGTGMRYLIITLLKQNQLMLLKYTCKNGVTRL